MVVEGGGDGQARVYDFYLFYHGWGRRVDVIY